MIASLSFGAFEIGIDLERWPAKILRALLRRHYEKNERHLLRHVIAPGDRVLELGSAIGVVALEASRIAGPAAVFGFDANPDMVDAARANAERNGIEIVFANRVLVPAARYAPDTTATFYKAPYFLSSSLLRHRDDMTALEIPAASLEATLSSRSANVLLMDIEGGEFDLIADADLAGIETLVMELHVEHGGSAAAAGLIDRLAEQGLHLDALRTAENVPVFSRTADHDTGAAFAVAYIASLAAKTTEAELAALDGARSLAPENASVQARIAKCLSKIGDTEGALDAARRAVAHDPDNSDHHEFCGVLLSARDRRDEALDAYRAAIASDAMRPLFHAAIGSLLASSGEVRAAQNAFRMATALVPAKACTPDFLSSLAARTDKFTDDGGGDGEHDRLDAAAFERLAEQIAAGFRLPDAAMALTHALAIACDDEALQCGLAALLATPADIRASVSV